MKTTVELPNDLLIAVEKAAAECQTTIRDLVERGLRGELALGLKPDGVRPAAIRWVTVDGGMPPGADVSDREQLQAWMHRQRR